jgi:hypothetical protein
VDTQPFSVNTIDIACKKILFRSEMVNKGKSKDIIIGDPRMSNISQKEIARKALDEKAKKSRGTGGQTQLMSQARQPDLCIADGSAPTCGRSGAQIDGPANLAGQSAHDQRRQRPHKARKETQGQCQYDAHGRLIKVGPTFNQLLAKYAGKKAFLCDRPTKKPRSPTKTK